MSYALELAGWVALQAVWQIFAVALLLLWSLRRIRGAPAVWRYRCASLQLMAAAGAVALTGIVSHASIALTHSLPFSDGGQKAWLPSRTAGFLSLVGCIWISGIVIAQLSLAVRLLRMRGLLSSYRPAPRHVSEIVGEICRATGSTAPRTLCGAIRSPMIAGVLRPILVVPRAFSASYPQNEMRSLLAHELAHIVRGDYSRNLFQLVTMSFLWWHPAAWLIYAAVRHERECACDEYALQHACSPFSLANALYRLAAENAAPELVTVGARSSGLSERVARLAATPECASSAKIHRSPAAAFAALAVIAIGSGSVASHSESLTCAYATSSVAPGTVFTIQARDPAGTFLVKMVRGRVVALELGREPVPSERLVQRGRMVTVMDAAGQPLLRLEVDPRGGFRWNARRAS